MKTILSLFTLLMTVYLTVASYDLYRESQFRVVLEYVYGDNHYRLKQMASADVLCTDSNRDWCFCGHCE